MSMTNPAIATIDGSNPYTLEFFGRVDKACEYLHNRRIYLSRNVTLMRQSIAQRQANGEKTCLMTSDWLRDDYNELCRINEVLEDGN